MTNFTTNVRAFTHQFIGIAALCERYEIKMEVIGVTDYRDGVLKLQFTGFEEDIELLKSEEELVEA